MRGHTCPSAGGRTGRSGRGDFVSPPGGEISLDVLAPYAYVDLATCIFSFRQAQFAEPIPHDGVLGALGHLLRKMGRDSDNPGRCAEDDIAWQNRHVAYPDGDVDPGQRDLGNSARVGAPEVEVDTIQLHQPLVVA